MRPAGKRPEIRLTKSGFESRPASSTLVDRGPSNVVGAHEFRNHFGYYMERAAAGLQILITRRGKPHSHLGPPIPASQQALDLAT